AQNRSEESRGANAAHAAQYCGSESEAFWCAVLTRRPIMKETRIDALQRMPIFGGIRADVLEFLLDSSGTVNVSKDDYFFHENDKAESMFVLEEGEVSVLKLWGGQQYVLRRLQQGDCFGEMALMDLFPRSASILAIAPCKAIELSTASFYKIY